MNALNSSYHTGLFRSLPVITIVCICPIGWSDLGVWKGILPVIKILWICPIGWSDPGAGKSQHSPQRRASQISSLVTIQLNIFKLVLKYSFWGIISLYWTSPGFKWQNCVWLLNCVFYSHLINKWMWTPYVQVAINYWYFVAQMCTREDTLAHNLGALYFDDVMSYNSLTTHLITRMVFEWHPKSLNTGLAYKWLLTIWLYISPDFGCLVLGSPLYTQNSAKNLILPAKKCWISNILSFSLLTTKQIFIKYMYAQREVSSIENFCIWLSEVPIKLQ